MYAVEFSHRSGRDLLNVAKKRTNIIPIIEDARHPHKYRMLVGKSSKSYTDAKILWWFMYVLLTLAVPALCRHGRCHLR